MTARFIAHAVARKGSRLTVRDGNWVGAAGIGPFPSSRGRNGLKTMILCGGSGTRLREQTALRYFNADPSCVMEYEPLEKLARDGQLMAYRYQGFFLVMGTHREYRELNALWGSKRAPWKVWA